MPGLSRWLCRRRIPKLKMGFHSCPSILLQSIQPGGLEHDTANKSNILPPSILRKGINMKISRCISVLEIQYRIARYGLPCERAIIALSRHDLQQPHAVMVELLLLCILRALRLAARPTRTRATPPLTFCLRSLVFSDLSFLPSFSFFDMSARAFLRSRFSFSFAAAFRLRSMIMSYSPRTLRASSSASTDFPSQCCDNT